jgi:hypothetical protein
MNERTKSIINDSVSPQEGWEVEGEGPSAYANKGDTSPKIVKKKTTARKGLNNSKLKESKEFDSGAIADLDLSSLDMQKGYSKGRNPTIGGAASALQTTDSKQKIDFKAQPTPPHH